MIVMGYGIDHTLKFLCYSSSQGQSLSIRVIKEKNTPGKKERLCVIFLLISTGESANKPQTMPRGTVITVSLGVSCRVAALLEMEIISRNVCFCNTRLGLITERNEMAWGHFRHGEALQVPVYPSHRGNLPPASHQVWRRGLCFTRGQMTSPSAVSFKETASPHRVHCFPS